MKAETARKEKALAQRYHKIKFFGTSSSNVYQLCLTIELTFMNMYRTTKDCAEAETGQEASRRMHGQERAEEA